MNETQISHGIGDALDKNIDIKKVGCQQKRFQSEIVGFIHSMIRHENITTSEFYHSYSASVQILALCLLQFDFMNESFFDKKIDSIS